jgi:K+-sensing histidine kinase KdpD
MHRLVQDGVDVDRSARHPHAQTGLGMGLVREIVEARGGRLFAGRSREGGAFFAVRMPTTHHGVASTPSSLQP